MCEFIEELFAAKVCIPTMNTVAKPVSHWMLGRWRWTVHLDPCFKLLAHIIHTHTLSCLLHNQLHFTVFMIISTACTRAHIIRVHPHTHTHAHTFNSTQNFLNKMLLIMFDPYSVSTIEDYYYILGTTLIVYVTHYWYNTGTTIEHLF